MAKKLLSPDGSPLLFQGKEVFCMENLGVVKQANVEKRTMVMVGTDETKDRDGDIIRLSGWDLTNYKKNPVFLWAHNYGSVPLASSDKVIKRKDPPCLEHFLRFPTKGIYPFADMILELYAEQIINASSVGFIPTQWKDMEPPPDNNETDGVRSRRTWGREYLKQELLELSGCAVPSNPNALQNALTGKSFGFKPEEMMKWLTGTTLIPRPEKVDDILEEMEKSKAEIIDETAPVQVQVPKEYSVSEKLEEFPTVYKDEVMGDIPIEEKDIIGKEEVLKPYPNEHACRLVDPGGFERFARKNCYRKLDGKCVDYIFGIKNDKTKLQAMRFPKESWTAGAAKAVCSSAGGSFEAASSSDVTPEEVKSVQVKIMVDEETIKSIISKLDELGQTVKSMADQIKDFLVNQAKANDKDPKKSEDKGVSSNILEDAFKQGSPKVPAPSNPPKATSEGVERLKDALLELKNVLSQIKIS